MVQGGLGALLPPLLLLLAGAVLLQPAPALGDPPCPRGLPALALAVLGVRGPGPAAGGDRARSAGGVPGGGAG